MLIVGLTGGLGTGKSTVSRMFADRGGRIVDADAMARHCMEPGQECFESVVREFGRHILNDGVINRSYLADIVFSDPERLAALEGIVHPYVRRETLKEFDHIRRGFSDAIVIWDIPLLFEKQLDQDADVTVVVAASRLQQVQRAVHRMNITPEDAARRIARQMPLEDKIRRADFVIHNDGSLEHTRRQVDEIWLKLTHRIKG